MRRSSTVSTWTKSAATIPRACAVRNCFPVGPVRRGAGAGPGGMQDLPHRRAGDRVAELDEFALHTPVPPRRIVRRLRITSLLIAAAVGGRSGRRRLL